MKLKKNIYKINSFGFFIYNRSTISFEAYKMLISLFAFNAT
ncbi:hypothetical protein APHACPA_1256 [Rickettsia amblyommatis str. Ac/Pa]|uniref:Uncharacterized protein n=1 Tax=Rickettsia amblyommatis str. Ac/Pa TaxID=1359164 RepID=A0A0F3N2E1_RICAM|nr:hypothetical protein APHACPA_1256 [Rickettsia amblyommatis str. Ac/Pa]